MAVARREVVLLVEERVVRDVHLPVDAEQRAVGVDDGRRIPVNPRRLPLEQRHDQDDRQLAGQPLHGRRSSAPGSAPPGRSGRLCCDLQKYGELKSSFRQMIWAPRAAASRMSRSARARLARRIGPGVVLDDPDGEWAGHNSIVISFLFRVT